MKLQLNAQDCHISHGNPLIEGCFTLSNCAENLQRLDRIWQEDYERLRLICALRKVGLILQIVIMLLDEFTEPNQVSKMLQKRSNELIHKLESLKKQHYVLTDMISKLKNLKDSSQMVRNIWLMFRFTDWETSSVTTEEASK